MGSRGPVPKISSEKLGHHTQEKIDHAPRGTAAEGSPDPDPEWHEIARDWFTSLALSGQSRFYEPSDWARARLTAEAMSRLLNGRQFSAVLFAAVISAAGELLDSEGARRRMRLELQNADETPEEVVDLDAWRRAL